MLRRLHSLVWQAGFVKSICVWIAIQTGLIWFVTWAVHTRGHVSDPLVMGLAIVLGFFSGGLIGRWAAKMPGQVHHYYSYRQIVDYDGQRRVNQIDPPKHPNYS